MAKTTASRLMPKLVAELFGTFLLVFGVIGTALFASGVADVGVGYLGIALAVGLTVIVGIYTVGHISGGHFNPAVSLGAAAAGRITWQEAGGYIVAQIVGGAIATSVLFLIALDGPDGFLAAAEKNEFVSNGFDAHSPSGFGLTAVIITELVLTAVFVYVVLGATDRRAVAGFAGLAIGLALTLIHLISIPIDATSVNPARSIATAIYGGGDALAQLWVFILVPAIGGLIAGFSYKPLFDRRA
ncbi:MAG TPA: aquaporin Z [Terrimesophilobacter sp.]|jgi:Glycerol uptake facilitator and related permeases (Major Intrinsic Protein Family)|uniref:aquaporin Z n=1 Tax=Terrimesophilobacter sp. TaxID=2906435 RepID=UPI002F91FFCB